MIRRTFRIGLWLGLLVGIGFAVAKLLRGRPSPAVIDLGPRGDALGPTPGAWPPLEAATPTPSPVQIPQPQVEPIRTDEPGLVMIGDEPMQTPPEARRTTLGVPPPKPPDAAGPAKKKAPAKKAAAKKAVARESAPRESAPKEPGAKKTLPPWVDPQDGICPQTHPVKAKLSSGIFQVEGNFAYARTSPDRCYQSPEAAAADGLRPAKR